MSAKFIFIAKFQLGQSSDEPWAAKFQPHQFTIHPGRNNERGCLGEKGNSTVAPDKKAYYLKNLII